MSRPNFVLRLSKADRRWLAKWVQENVKSSVRTEVYRRMRTYLDTCHPGVHTAGYRPPKRIECLYDLAHPHNILDAVLAENNCYGDQPEHCFQFELVKRKVGRYEKG